MEEAGKDQQVAPSASAGKSKLRYQLRSAAKSKDEKPSPEAVPLSSATKRSRPASGVSKSMNVLDLSGKDKSAKPPRRLSIPAKTNGTPATKKIDSMTPISKTRLRRSAISQTKSDTPSSEISKSGMRCQFNRLSTASYWLSQIKLAETANKHDISLGFFKLALKAGCEPQQQMRNELKAYARKHDLHEHEAVVKKLFGRFNVTESLEDLLAAKNISEVVQGSTKASDDDVKSTSSIKSRNLQPKSLNNDAAHASQPARSVNLKSLPKKSPVPQTRGSVIKSSVTSKISAITRNVQKNLEKTNMQKSGKEKAIITKEDMKTGNTKDVSGAATGNLEEDKENMGSIIQQEELATMEAM